jgi:hypothetical protein
MKNRVCIALASIIIIQVATMCQAFARSDLTFNLESQANPSASADPQVRVVVTNTGSKVLRVPLMSARYEVTLYVYDQSGKVVKPNQLMPEFCSAGCTDALSLKPGEQFIPGMLAGGMRSEWIPLSAWGYPHLARGTYSIMAQPGVNLGGTEIVTTDISADQKRDQGAESNVLTINIP